MPVVNFIHPLMDRPLSVDTGMNSIRWSYRLQTQSWPTYGGEVVQILGTFIDNISLQGTVRNYAKSEEIYGWFIDYLELATQGTHGDPSYNEDPVVMFYPERGWTIMIQPISVPGFRLNTETVAVDWSLEAAVYEPDPAMAEFTLQQAIAGLTEVDADIGYIEDNPFSDPKAEGRKKDKKAATDFAELVDPVAKAMLNVYDKLKGGDASILLGAKVSGPAPDVKEATNGKEKTQEKKATKSK